MRKAIPVSLVLVALSLVGFVILQINWVISTQQLQKQKIGFKAERVAQQAADSLRKINSMNILTYRMQGFPNVSLSAVPNPYIKINQRLTHRDIDNIIHKYLVDNDIEKFETAYVILFGPRLSMNIEFASSNYNDINRRLSIDSVYYYNTYFTGIAPINSQPNADDGIFSVNEGLTIIVPNLNKQAWSSIIWILIGSALLTLITISAFYLTVRIMLQQRNLSKIKSDFINNMTHEFKTPLATISLAVDALHNTRVQGNKEKTQYFSGIIKEENKRMNKHVETILQAAFMEKQELNLNKNEIHVHNIIEKLIQNFSLQLADKKGEVVTHFNAANDLITGDEVHITNLVNNLIDNAVKYSKPDVPPRIVITTTNSAKNLIIQINDNGIGMSKESVKRIFEKFYRAHTGNIHNVKGFGLGMSYVKDIITAHKGKIKVESIPGKGSTFIVELPLS
ncbi:MAG: HAMP domain-containing sensor histidine kinase [Arachidicoccus sp.]|nr:HAMP domain-containing sensor histidine kinase [Arachidicoccus sp.]